MLASSDSGPSRAPEGVRPGAALTREQALPMIETVKDHCRFMADLWGGPSEIPYAALAEALQGRCNSIQNAREFSSGDEARELDREAAAVNNLIGVVRGLEKCISFGRKAAAVEKSKTDQAESRNEAKPCT